MKETDRTNKAFLVLDQIEENYTFSPIKSDLSANILNDKQNFGVFLREENLFFAMDLHAAVLYDSYTLEQLDIYFSETNLFNNQVTYLEQQRGHEIRLHFFEETSYLLFKIIKEPISNRDQNSEAAKWKLVYLGRDDLKRDHGWRWEANSFSSGITDQLPSIGRVSIITQVLSPNSVCLLTFLP